MRKWLEPLHYFSDLVTIGEIIELDIKSRKIIDGSSKAVKVENPRLEKSEEDLEDVNHDET